MKTFILRLYQLSLLLLIFWGAHAWFLWEWDFLENDSKVVIYFIFSVIAIAYKYVYNVRIKSNVKLWTLIFFLIMAFLVNFPTINTFIMVFLFAIPLIVLIHDDNAQSHLKFVSIIIACVLIPGLLLYTVVLFGVGIPGVPIQHGDLSSVDSYVFVNHFFLIRPIAGSWHNDSIRFCSIFLEPSYLGTLLAFLLFANNFNFKKKYNIVLLVGLIASFSLAGIITAFVGYYLGNVKNLSFLIKPRIVCSIIILIAIFSFSSTYNNGNNIINKRIVERIQFTNDDRIIAGNNRSNAMLDDAFDEMISRGQLLTGLGRYLPDNLVGAGYKRYLVEKGLISAIMFLFVYIILGSYSKNRFYGRCFTLLIIITFVQAAYPSSYSWLIPMLLGVRTH